MQRYVGALLSTLELLVEYQPKNVGFFVSSTYTSLLGGFEKPSFLLDLLRDYRGLFSYSYNFNRKTGKSPKLHNAILNQYLSSGVDINEDFDENDDYSPPTLMSPGLKPLHPFQTSKQVTIDDNIGNSSINKDRNISDDPDSDFYSPSHAHTENSEVASAYDLNRSGWNIEEDEDSDGADYVPPAPVAKKKTATRMRGSAEKPRELKSKRVSRPSKRKAVTLASATILDHSQSNSYEDSNSSGGWPSPSNKRENDDENKHPSVDLEVNFKSNNATVTSGKNHTEVRDSTPSLYGDDLDVEDLSEVDYVENLHGRREDDEDSNEESGVAVSLSSSNESNKYSHSFSVRTNKPNNNSSAPKSSSVGSQDIHFSKTPSSVILIEDLRETFNSCENSKVLPRDLVPAGLRGADIS